MFATTVRITGHQPLFIYHFFSSPLILPPFHPPHFACHSPELHFISIFSQPLALPSPFFIFTPFFFFSLQFVYIYAIIFNECAPVLLTKPSYCINLGFSCQGRGQQSSSLLFRGGSAQSSVSEALPSNPSRACGLYWRSRRRQVILIRPYSSG